MLTENIKEGDIVLYETPHYYGRKTYLAEGAVVAGQVLANGTDATTQKKPVVAAGTGANAVALRDAADGDKVLVLERGPAIVKKTGLTYGTAATDANKTATDALLQAVGIQVRAGV